MQQVEKNNKRNKTVRRRTRNKSQKERIITMTPNFQGAPVYRFRLRLGSINISSTGAGAVSSVSSITKSLLTTDGAAIIDAYQKYRFWKAEFHCYGCTTGSGIARFFAYDSSLASSPEDNTQYKIIPTNTASASSHTVLTYEAVDYPDLDFVDNGVGSTLCKFGIENVGNSTFAVSTLVYVIEVWGHFDVKMFGS